MAVVISVASGPADQARLNLNHGQQPACHGEEGIKVGAIAASPAAPAAESALLLVAHRGVQLACSGPPPPGIDILRSTVNNGHE